MTRDITRRVRIRKLLECLLLVGILAGAGYLFYLFIWPCILLIVWLFTGGGL